MKKYDLTEGKILNKLLLVALPIMATQFIQMAYNFTDMFWLGKLGGKVASHAIASSGVAGLYMWLLMTFAFVGRMGAEIGVSQHFGKKDLKGAKEFSQNSVFISLILGLACGFVYVIFSRTLISFYGIKEENVAQDAANYLSIIGIAVPFTFLTNSLTGTFNGSGNSVMSLVANFAGLVINMVLDPLLIFGFNLGVNGAAIATAIAQIAVCVIFLIAIKKIKGRPFERYSFRFKISTEKIIKIIKWTIPISIETLLFSSLTMTITGFVSKFSAEALSVQSVGAQIESLSWLIGGGFGSALTAFVGQNFGATKWNRIHKGFKISLIAMSVWGAIITLFLFFGGRYLFRVFLSEPNILKMGEEYLKILAACQLIFCLEAISAGVFRGIGKTIPPSLVSGISNALRVPLAYFLSKTFLGLNGIWWGITIGASIRGIWIFIWYLVESKKFPKIDEKEILTNNLEHQ